MPRKPPRNAFYFFMVNYKEEQREKGVTYANMAEVSQAAGPLWASAGPEVRARFEAMAKAEKVKASAPENKFLSTGVSLAELQNAERVLQEAAEAEKKDIINFVKSNSVNKRILDEDIFVMDVNSYCKARGIWLVGEFTLIRFSLRQGVKDSYHQLVNPGIPYAFHSDVKYGSKEYALPMLDEADPRTDYIKIYANMLDFLKKTDGGPNRDHLPPIYTLPDKVPQCLDFVMETSRKAVQNDTQFRVYQLHTLFFHLVYHISPPYRNDDRFPKEALALTQLERDTTFKYCSGLACKMHDEADRAVVCSSTRAFSWTFTVLEMTCALLDMRAQPGRHVPLQYQPDEEEQPTEHRRFANDSPDASSDADESVACGGQKPSSDTSATAAAETAKKRHVPLRMPKINYSLSVRAAPDLTDNRRDFPPLPTRGRGRGVVEALQRMGLTTFPQH